MVECVAKVSEPAAQVEIGVSPLLCPCAVPRDFELPEDDTYSVL